jgi:hypothetical protein
MKRKPRKLTLKQKVELYEAYLDKLACWHRPVWFTDTPEQTKEVRELLEKVRGPQKQDSEPPTDRQPTVPFEVT